MPPIALLANPLPLAEFSPLPPIRLNPLGGPELVEGIWDGTDGPEALTGMKAVGAAETTEPDIPAGMIASAPRG